MKKKIVFVPRNSKGSGMGHIKRCLDLQDNMKGPGREPLILEKEEPDRIPFSSPFIIKKTPPGGILILDNKNTTLEELRDYNSGCILAAIDEGGEARDYIPYLIDTLPLPSSYSTPNCLALHGAAFYNGKRIIKTSPFKKVLVSFGGEDRAGLTDILLNALLKGGLFTWNELTVIRGPGFGLRNWPAKINIIDSPGNVGEILPGYDLLISHFGLTAFEALATGTPVLLLNPTTYHKKLSQRAFIPEIGVKKVRTRKLKRLITHREWVLPLISDWAARFRNSKPISSVIEDIEPVGSRGCPICGEGVHKAVARFISRTYFRCSSCGIIYLLNFKKNRNVYKKEYFFSEYKKQYGRTYLEDFENIKGFSERRIEILSPLAGGAAGRRFLDVGCAFGPFLEAVKEAGGIPLGTDISPEAVKYVNRELGIEAICGDFTDMDAPMLREPFDVLTMWYVIEHFAGLGRVLGRVNRLLKKGGIFAFSTPNNEGISSKKDREHFLEMSPPDHYTVWSPRVAGRVLKQYGFKVLAVNVTGHHPGRFPLAGRCRRNSFVWKALHRISRAVRLGDTFEIYAGKVDEYEE